MLTAAKESVNSDVSYLSQVQYIMQISLLYIKLLQMGNSSIDNQKT